MGFWSDNTDFWFLLLGLVFEMPGDIKNDIKGTAGLRNVKNTHHTASACSS